MPRRQNRRTEIQWGKNNTDFMKEFFFGISWLWHLRLSYGTQCSRINTVTVITFTWGKQPIIGKQFLNKGNSDGLTY